MEMAAGHSLTGLSFLQATLVPLASCAACSAPTHFTPHAQIHGFSPSAKTQRAVPGSRASRAVLHTATASEPFLCSSLGSFTTILTP